MKVGQFVEEEKGMILLQDAFIVNCYCANSNL